MKSLKEWYLEFMPHPDEPSTTTSSDVRFSEWLERTDNKLIKKHIFRINRLNRLKHPKTKQKII